MVRIFGSPGSLVGLFFGLSVLGYSAPAAAAGGGEVVSLTFSPLHLFAPIFEAEGEVRLMPALGVAAIGGVGSLSTGGVTFGVTEVGAQVAAYPLGDFRSLQLGGEILWLHVNGSLGNVTGFASGVAAGPFVGYKLIAKPGFTFFVQGGAEYAFAHAEASSTTGQTATDKRSAVIVLFNLNLGWSF
jgi:hypothetical protein